MAALKGERFDIDLSSDRDENERVSAPLASDFVRDIQERTAESLVKPPSPPRIKVSSLTSPSARGTGFPAHKKRTTVSASKQQTRPSRPELGDDQGRENPNRTQVIAQDEKRRIHLENQKRLQSMTEDEILQERRELLSGMSASLIDRLTKRANLDDARGDTGIEPPSPISDVSPTLSIGDRNSIPGAPTFDPDAAPLVPPPDLTSVKSAVIPPKPAPSLHFPRPATPPALDPSSPNFLAELHTKYFASLPADPSKLAWMTAPETDTESPYSPSLPELPPSALRFNFRGVLLPPRTAQAVASNLGLHHHGDAPEAAGYTLPELARLARSAFPAQRSIAFQTLGRVLYRLGRGEWGSEGSDIAAGLWRIVEEGRVLDSLTEASKENAPGGVSVRAHAVEALWNWQKGGGKKLQAQ
ncbi:MAG: hypothetical protein M1825_004897 [Sarcosagium campestre]|nr:MAG: hypothetical protein M1825_004897 [Sarcosagium campestre]